MQNTKEAVYWQDCNRETAILITNDGKVYEDINHQYCLDDFQKDYFEDMSFEDDIGEMVKITDALFRKGEFHGFDLYVGRDDRKILASHYPRAYEVGAVKEAAFKYAKTHDCIIATFTDTQKLGKEMVKVA